MTDKLNSGEQFPTLSLQLAGGESITLPASIESPMAVVLFYRGHW